MTFSAARYARPLTSIRRFLPGACFMLFAALLPVKYAAPVAAPADSTDQPGTITFTVGVKISGKVEKPQVVIFLPKEKTLYREETFNRSFSEELSQPLPFTPIIR